MRDRRDRHDQVRRLHVLVARQEQQHRGDDHPHDRGQPANRRADHERLAPLAALPLHRADLDQLRRQRRALRGPAVERRGRHAEGREQQQAGQQRPGQLGGLGQRAGDARHAEQRQRRLGPVRPQRLPPLGLLAGLWRAQERGLLGEQGQHRGPRHHQRGGLPDEERADRVPPRRAGAAAEQGDRPHQAEQHQHRDRGHKERGELAEQLAAPGGQVDGPGQQEDQEHQAEQVAVPLHRAGQVRPPLAGAEVVLLGDAAGQQRAPVHPQDLDAAETPPVALALERLEGQRHDALAVGLVHVPPGPAGPQQPQRQLGVLGDAPLIPAAELLERDPPDQPHRAREDRAVPLVARRLGHREEILVGVVQPPVVPGTLPATVILRRLGEANPALGEQGCAALEERPIELVIGVDHADDLGPLVGHPGQGVVQRSRLVAGPVLQVRELYVVPPAPGLDRAPQALVVGVVVDQDDLVARVIQAHQRAQRVDDHVRRLVVRRDVQADERQLADRGQLRGRDRREPPVPGLRADGVADLPEVGAGQDRGEQLEEPEQHPARLAGRAEMAVEGPLKDVDEVDGEQEDARRPAQVGARVPAPGHRQPEQAAGDQAGHARDRVVLADPEQPHRHRDQRAKHHGADDREREPAGGRPRSGGPRRVRGAGKQRDGADRRGQDPGQHKRSKHEPALPPQASARPDKR